ncbi:putative RNA-binding Zn ribbon-like protein [Kribbella steppae]|uniref:Putative RNA-binding Zn ribbon-like protein n=1 Tax=Kribbella steppae TaxID=2512223 RepID=A0A4R2H1G8_9ACTN|nr:CGNR zinc finger domain-containing protein [Kribbella steppae]TCO18536.1 putative RNA-binding Zn ribbon-like protein [Kribbella steppae]
MIQPGERTPAPEPLVLVQDLVNTVDLEMERDALTEPAELSTFCAAHGLPDLRFDQADLAEVLTLREAVRDVCQAHAGVDVPAESLAALDRLLAEAPLRLALSTDGGVTIHPADGLRNVPALVARIAADVAAATQAGTWPRLKACAADTCRWVYYDRSPAGRSRWCTMSLCGSRNKMRKYRARS